MSKVSNNLMLLLVLTIVLAFNVSAVEKIDDAYITITETTVTEIDESGAKDCTDRLSCDVSCNLRPFELTGSGEANGNRRIQVGPADLADAEYGCKDSKAPSSRNHDPASIIALGLIE